MGNLEKLEEEKKFEEMKQILLFYHQNLSNSFLVVLNTQGIEDILSTEFWKYIDCKAFITPVMSLVKNFLILLHVYKADNLSVEETDLA